MFYLHTTISPVLVSRLVLTLRNKDIALLLWTMSLQNLQAVSVLFLLVFIYPVTPVPANLHIQLPRFPLPRFQRPHVDLVIWRI